MTSPAGGWSKMIEQVAPGSSGALSALSPTPSPSLSADSPGSLGKKSSPLATPSPSSPLTSTTWKVSHSNTTNEEIGRTQSYALYLLVVTSLSLQYWRIVTYKLRFLSSFFCSSSLVKFYLVSGCSREKPVLALVKIWKKIVWIRFNHVKLCAVFDNWKWQISRY